MVSFGPVLVYYLGLVLCFAVLGYFLEFSALPSCLVFCLELILLDHKAFLLSLVSHLPLVTSFPYLCDCVLSQAQDGTPFTPYLLTSKNLSRFLLFIHSVPNGQKIAVKILKTKDVVHLKVIDNFQRVLKAPPLISSDLHL